MEENVFDFDQERFDNARTHSSGSGGRFDFESMIRLSACRIMLDLQSNGDREAPISKDTLIIWPAACQGEGKGSQAKSGACYRRARVIVPE